jgi:hypothetical protein
VWGRKEEKRIRGGKEEKGEVEEEIDNNSVTITHCHIPSNPITSITLYHVMLHDIQSYRIISCSLV